MRTRRGAPTGRSTRRSAPLQRRDAALCVGMRRPRWQSIRRRVEVERRDGYRDPDVAGAGPLARPERELRARVRARLAGRPAPGPDAGGGRAPGANSPCTRRVKVGSLHAGRSRAGKVPRAGWRRGTV
ncbi:hypothetical protein D1006_41075 [Burkholderia stabilis]|uniref:Uncharacterized protein n=1 Tax=Burkholderia stabilis TaxID=95485 RepID=A0A4Q2A502_9BURK|nr:hypothetical protein D1006_41075 [Burkholderia stabilis]